MGETELYRELGQLSKDKSRWGEKTPYVSSLLSHDSVKIRAKALWLLGEMGFAHPESVHDTIPAIAAFISNPEPLLRERAANALGRIGRADFSAIESYFEDLFRFADDENAKLRLAVLVRASSSAQSTRTSTSQWDNWMVFGGDITGDNIGIQIALCQIAEFMESLLEFFSTSRIKVLNR
ncbi:MAG: HEAT repeat domain-containing protein [Atopobiaceae bacterium]|uniref:HEAT repeat domain-containing protein n=1 Tax=Muricaecibacterium torontonense TaxID=3032871 RepID=A0A4S2F023_9ACTN|nr:HEAT repeat domain-containing protein [Muricaecibacterium torontonense]MCI8676222.1 HEAT repeat domain-containing protein [Atopobiaceae bacterium]TGY62198.1 HEAT repeat domain-containing protein [Muricaecibacterium torontonense]